MGYFTEQLKNYLASSTEEQIAKDFKELEEFNKIGPTLEEYLHCLEEIPEMLIKNSTIDNPEFSLDYSFI